MDGGGKGVQPELPAVGRWARDKLNVLRKYLDAYTTVLRGKRFEGLVYVDAFAGGGRSVLRQPQPQDGDELQLSLLDAASYKFEEEAEEQEYLDGSPRVALDLKHPFTHYVFVELDPDRLENLRSLQSEHSRTRNIRVRAQDCNEYLLSQFLPAVDWRKWRGLVFLDPFGMHVPWSTIDKLAATKAIEVLINFPVGMAVGRRLLRDLERMSDKLRGRLDEYFGSPEWYELIYPERGSLFGAHRKKVEEPGKVLALWYQSRLRDAFGYASPPMLVRNSRGGHLYYLIHATSNRTGARIARDVLLRHGECVE